MKKIKRKNLYIVIRNMHGLMIMDVFILQFSVQYELRKRIQRLAASGTDRYK
jgi:hypothetical protein